MAKIFFVGLDGAEKSYRLQTHRPFTLGRDPGNDLTLDHPQISRFHARLQLLAETTLQVTDLNSTNGTFIDGQQLKGTANVPSGVKAPMCSS